MEASEVCKNCNQVYPIHESELHWCHHCNWNLEGDQSSDNKETSYQKTYRELGRKFAQQLFDELSSARVARPRFNLNKFLAYSFATLIHFSTLLIFLLGILGFAFFVWWVAAVIAIPLFAIGWTVMPKPRKLPKDVLDRDKFPTLYTIAHNVAKEMKTTPPAALVVLENFNAYYTEYRIGPWRKKVISLGLPLIHQLTDEEIVAVIAHETSHGANGDVGRSTYLWGAVRALENWHHILLPSSFDEGRGYTFGGYITAWISNFLGWLFSFIPSLGAYVLAHLVFSGSQEAEYLADRLAAEVCGTEAMTATLVSISNGGKFQLAVQQASISKSDVNVFDLVDQLASRKKSDHELERLSRVEVLRGLSLDATHPPSTYRRKFLAPTSFPAKIIIDIESSIALRRELDSLKRQVSNKLKDAYLNKLYYGSNS
jgi:heat shock protein HtpX